MKLLYYSPASFGGLADYAHEQANALAAAGTEVDFLCPENYQPNRAGAYHAVKILREAKGDSGFIRKWQHTQSIVENIRILAGHIREHQFSHVLFGSYFEYLAPLWASTLERLATSEGIVFGAVVHDPVRDFVLGPAWWHRWSVGRAYSFLREAFVHEPIELDTARPMPRLRTTVIPHGVYSFPAPTETRKAARARFGLPQDARVLLSFGHIRDGKNLNLVLRAMREFPDIWLLVAGDAQSSGQKPAEFYEQLAHELGVAERCRWHIGYVEAADAGNFFIASDAVLLTYSRAFRSASGVLNAAVFFRKPCIASGGQGNLCSMVQKYGLGVWIEPDDAGALASGLERWKNSPPAPKWDDYCSENSWQRNAEIVLRQMK